MLSDLLAYFALIVPLAAEGPVPLMIDGVEMQHPVEAPIVELTNAERVRNGASPVKVDAGLMRTARQHAAWMTNNRAFQHGNYSVAENIAMGQDSASDALHSWMNSSGHRANILNRGHTRIGVAAYTSPDGTIYWCQQFRH